MFLKKKNTPLGTTKETGNEIDINAKTQHTCSHVVHKNAGKDNTV
jgi:hypothetical protein